MKTKFRLLGTCLLAMQVSVLLASRIEAQACTILIDPRNEIGTVWFQGTPRLFPMVQPGSLPAPRAAGVVEIASGFFQTAAPPSLPAYFGGSFSWTPEHVYLSLFGLGVTTTEVLDPLGGPITGTQGIAVLGAAFRNTFDQATGLTTSVGIEGAVYVFTRDHVYLVLVGGALTTVEVTDPVGAPIAGARGVAVLGGRVDDTDPMPCSVSAVAQGAAFLFTGANVYLNLVGGALTTTEVQDSGSAIGGARGVNPMAVVIPPPGVGALEGAAYVWTDTRVYLVLVGGALTVTEVLDPTGVSIPDTWGIVRLGGGIFATMAGNTYQGAAEILTPGQLYLSAVGGGVVTTEILDPVGGSIATRVRTVGPPSIRQAWKLYGATGVMQTPGGRQGGRIVGVMQGAPDPGT